MQRKGLVFLGVIGLLAAAGYVAYARPPALAPYLPVALAPASVAQAKTDPSDMGSGKGTGAGSPGEKTGDKAGDGAGQSGRKGMQRPPAVTTAEAKVGALAVTRNTIGTIVPSASTNLASPSSGIVAEVLVSHGADVKKGDLIVRLDDRTINANIARDNANLMKDQAALDNANANLKRMQTLSSTGTGTRQQYDEAVAAAKQAEAAIAVSTATLTADKVALTETQIRAPFDGKLGVVQVSPGAFVSAGANIVTVTGMKPLFAEFTLPETDLALARAALAERKLAVTIQPTLAANGSKPATGPVVFIDNAVDQASGTFRLRAEMANADGAFWPGQSLDVTVQAGEKSGLVLVPTVAVQPRNDGFICFVLGEDKTVSVRKVTVAMTAGNVTGISSGLREGDLVVTEGQASLTDGARVSLGGTQGNGSGTGDGKGAAKGAEKVAANGGAAP